MTFHHKGVIEGRETFVELVDMFTAVIDRRHSAMLDFLAEPHTIDEMADHRLHLSAACRVALHRVGGAPQRRPPCGADAHPRRSDRGRSGPLINVCDKVFDGRVTFSLSQTWISQRGIEGMDMTRPTGRLPKSTRPALSDVQEKLHESLMSRPGGGRARPRRAVRRVDARAGPRAGDVAAARREGALCDVVAGEHHRGRHLHDRSVPSRRVFEFAVDPRPAIRAGVDEAAIDRLGAGEDPGFEGDEAAAHAVATEILRDHRISDATYADAESLLRLARHGRTVDDGGLLLPHLHPAERLRHPPGRRHDRPLPRLKP